MKPLTILCPRLPTFSWDDLDAARRAFASAPSLSMGQAWLPEIEPDFAPASVRVGWSGDSLYLLAELTDADISTRTTRDNERLWELGDVFETFLRPDGQDAYTELHVAPNNCHLQLRFPNAGSLESVRATGSVSQFLVHNKIFDSCVWVLADEKRWIISSKIPGTAIREKPRPLAGDLWHFSFSRYDYTTGRAKPVISSTSPHTIARFHRQEEWGAMQFE
jgi:hypothetical protein